MGNNSPAYDGRTMQAVSKFYDRLPDAETEADKRVAEIAAADAAGLWELADIYMPADIREFAERHKLDATVPEMWRSAWIAGWRAAMHSKHNAKP